MVRQGKGRKDRQVPMSERLLDALRDYWRWARPQTWLFPGQTPDGTLHPCVLQKMCKRLVAQLGWSKRVTPHTLRHSFATHMLEAGIDLVTLQNIMGHTRLTTTALYLHICSRRLQAVPSLLDRLLLPQSSAEPQSSPNGSTPEGQS